MQPPPGLALLLVAAAAHAHTDFDFQITDEQYYEMPRLFHLDDWQACAARRQLYCVGSFQLRPATENHTLYDTMKRYSANWVDRFDHTRLHRGVCLPARCPLPAPAPAPAPAPRWFEECVNATTWSRYSLSARLRQLDYCAVAGEERPPLGAATWAALAAAALLVLLCITSTTLDLLLQPHKKNAFNWALAWSLPGCWRELFPEQAVGPEADNMRVLDGARAVSMLCVIIEHVCWLGTQSYLVSPRYSEQTRRAPDVLLLANSTLVVQVFFMLSTYLLARRELSAPAPTRPLRHYASMLVRRLVRISPAYWAVVWFAACWWERLGNGPMWAPLVGAEAAVCRRKWWTHLLYVNNVVQPDDKCLIQTWYLAADMQLYALTLGVILVGRRMLGSVSIAALGGALLAIGALAAARGLQPTFVLHSPETVRAAYAGSASFDLLYQSPLGGLPGALAGLLLAQARVLLARGVSPRVRTALRWGSVCAFPLGVWWAASAPMLVDPRPNAGWAVLAAMERAVFALLMALALLGGLEGASSPWRTLLAWRGWAAPARLSFAALLLHLPIDKALLATRLQPTQLDRPNAVLEWCGVAVLSYLAALPLALLVEVPVQRLSRALQPARVSDCNTPPDKMARLADVTR